MLKFDPMLIVFAAFIAGYLFMPTIFRRAYWVVFVSALGWIIVTGLLNSPHFYFYVAIIVAIALEYETITPSSSHPLVWAMRYHVPVVGSLIIWCTSWALDPADYGLWGRLLLLMLLISSFLFKSSTARISKRNPDA